MTSYQYWRGNIFMGEENSVERVELDEPMTCPYCKAQTDVIFNRITLVQRRDEHNRPLWYTDEGGFWHMLLDEDRYPIGCPECMEEYERGEKGYYPAYGLGPEVDQEREDRHNCRGTDYEY